MTDRERFEAFWLENDGIEIRHIDRNGDGYHDSTLMFGWTSWQASRKQAMEEVAQEAEGSAEWYMEQARGGDNSGASDHCADALVVFAGEIRALATPEGEQG